MYKKYFAMLTILVVILLSSCEDKKETIKPILPDDLITMDELDQYMFREDVQYVDLRNYDASFKSGFIYSFEVIPFFDYLDFRTFDRGNTYLFNPSQIIHEEELYRLFDKEKAIFLYADGCIRAGYLKDVLDYLGYERVYVLGGIGDYKGEYLKLGDGVFSIGNTFYSLFYDEDSDLTYHISGIYELDRTITNLRIDIVDSFGISLRSTNYDENIDYNLELTTLENFIVKDIITPTELYYLLTDDNINKYDEIPGFSLEYEQGFINALYRLIAKKN